MSREGSVESRMVVGIDLHPDSLSAAIAKGASVQDMKILKVFRKVDFAEWERFLSKDIPAGSVLALEASGNSFEFADQARMHGHRPFVLDSVSVGRIAKAYCKTDPKDARRMAKVYLCGLAEEVWIPDVGTRIAREVASAYENAKTDLTRANNRTKMFLNGRRIRLDKKHGNLGLKLMLGKGKCVSIAAVARKLAVALWYALKGFIPDILSHVENLNGKLLGISRELTLAHAKSLGFKNCVALANEYTRIVTLAMASGGGCRT
jgi:hypothetical protein